MKATSVHRPEHAVLVRLLREKRIELGLTQAAVGEQLGVAQTAISDIEINERGVDFLLVRDLCRIYGEPMEDFLRRFENQLREEKPAATRLVRKDKKRS